ncbi:MAG: hypothetical protein AABZ47_03120 [Planctomycetota bacterium]
MRDLRHAGLSGKARLKRDRSRASRIHARQWISEYHELGEDAHEGADSVPIGRRAYFLPSAATVGEVAVAAQPTQLEFPLISDLSSSNMGPGATQPEIAATKTPRVSSSPLVTLHIRRDVQRRFSLRDFAWGCALGGVAAAIALTILLAVFG